MIRDIHLRNFEIIGEASKKISLIFRENHNEIPWKEIAGTRDKLIHDYMGVDIDVIWKTINEDLKILKKILEEINL